MSQLIVRRGFETRLKTWADAQVPAIPVAWQNVPFTPPAGRYIRASVLPATTRSDTLDRAHRRFTGIFQADFVMPTGTGPAAVETLIASLDAAFAAYFTQDGVRIYLTSPFGAAPALTEADRYVVPASAAYRADTV